LASNPGEREGERTSNTGCREDQGLGARETQGASKTSLVPATFLASPRSGWRGANPGKVPSRPMPAGGEIRRTKGEDYVSGMRMFTVQVWAGDQEQGVLGLQQTRGAVYLPANAERKSEVAKRRACKHAPV